MQTHSTQEASMQTQCPHCQTLFHLTREQLHMAEGLVRCGVCKEVYNALDTPPAPDDRLLAAGEQDIPAISNPPAQSDASTAKPQQAQTPEADDAFDLFQPEPETEETLSFNSVIPDEIRRQATQQSSTLSSLLWSLAILFLAFTLVAEYVWFNRNKLIQLPQARPWVKRICELTDCELAALSDPSQIKLLSRKVYTHPNQKHALMINITMVNHASFIQPYPDMLIKFSDIRGHVVASRRFQPEQYLHRSRSQLPLLKPDIPVSFTMEVEDPGKNAMTYEFDFL